MAVNYYTKNSGAFTYQGDTRGGIMNVPVSIDGITGGTWDARLASAVVQIPSFGSAAIPAFPGLFLNGWAAQNNGLACLNNTAQSISYWTFTFVSLLSGTQFTGASDIAPPIVESGSVSESVLQDFDTAGNLITVPPPSTQTGQKSQPARFQRFAISHVLRLRRRMATTVYEQQSEDYSGKTNSLPFRGRASGTLLMLDIQGGSSTEGEGYDVAYNLVQDNNEFDELIGWADESNRVDINATLGNGVINVTGSQKYESIDFNNIPGLNT